MPHYTPDTIAAGIITEGEHRGITEKGICIAISTGLVETNLVMYANHADPESLTYPHDAIGSDANSVGVFQQRDPWWGTCHDRMHVEPSAGMFYAELVKHDYNSDAHTPGCTRSRCSSRRIRTATTNVIPRRATSTPA